MNTRFTEIYKKELRGGGILSSMGSAALGRARERLDVRNMLFGGSGFISSTGQKIFGKGYSATGSSASKLTTGGNAAAGATIVNELASSMAKQETLLAVIAKNTMNMNYMARDMNIMRQNIITLTKSVAGKSSKNADALFFSAKRRDSILSSKASLNKRDTTKSDGASESPSGKTSYLGSLVSGVMGVMGGVGSGILGALRGVLAISPILGIIGLAGAAYVIKELAKLVDFGAIKDRIVQAIGFDPDSDKSFSEQLTEKLDNIFGTTKFTESLDWVKENFNEQINMVGQTRAKISDIVLVYTQATFRTLAESFSNMGKIFAFLFNEFFEVNKGKILAAITLGIMGPAALTSLKGAAGVAAVTTLAGAFGAATGEKSRDELRDEIAKGEEDLESVNKKFLAAKTPDRAETYVPQMIKLREQIDESKAQLKKKEDKLNEYLSLPSGFGDKVDELKKQLPGGEYGAGYSPVSRPSSTSPSRVNNSDVLALIRRGESGKMGYDAANRGNAGDMPGGIPGLSSMKVGEVMQLQADKKLFAAGAYQIIPRTLADLMNGVFGKTGVSMNDTFDQNTQDKLGQTLLNFALKKAGGDPIKMQEEIAKIWAAVADPTTGLSRHGNVGNNKASISGEQIQKALSGSTLTQASNNLAAMTRDMNVAQAPTVVVNASSAPVVPGKGQSAPVASATNVDALELFFKYAM